MKTLRQLGLCGCLAAAAFANQHAGGGRVHASARALGRGHSGAHGYGRYGFGGYYGLPYDSYSYPSPEPIPPRMLVYPQTTQPAPEPPVHSVIHEYGSPEDFAPPPAQDNRPILYLIAFRDKSIRAATTYWVADGTLHYLDTDHKEQHAALSSVDSDLSARLNRERRVPFGLP